MAMSENLYPLPNGWEWRKLDDIKISNVIGLVRNTAEQKHSNTYKYIKMNNISNDNKFNPENIVYVDASPDEVEKFSLKKGDFLFNTRNSIELVGKSCIFDSDESNILFNNNIMRIRFDSNISSCFIAYQFNSSVIKKQLEPMKSGTTNVAAIYYKTLKELQILVPPLEEQKRIVQMLDGLFAKADKAMALLDESIASASALLPSALNEVFGELEGKHKKEKLEKFDNKMSAGGTPLKSKSEYWNGGIEWFSSGELNNLYTETSKEKITEIGLKNSSAKLFQKGTLLIGMYDTAAMKMSILHTNASCNQAIVGVKPNENELSIFFLKYQLEYLKPKILEERQGVRQQNLNLSKIKNIVIEHPPLNIQTEVVAHLDAVREKTERLNAKLRSQRDELIALKASLLERAFKGEL